jgi:phosphonate transport system permease protein
MKKTNSIIQAILATEKKSLIKKLLQSLFFISIFIVCFYFVDFFDKTRMLEGIPSIGILFLEMVPPNFTEFNNWVRPLIDTLVMSIAGTVFALILSFPLGLLAASNTSPHKFIYSLSRLILNFLRAIPELILGIIFVAAVGFGALPGVLALGLHSAGMMGKFFAEQIEHLDPHPIEAARAVGASRLQVIRYAIFPQLYSQGADLTIYRWEYNFRASTVMGMVGAGGVGAELIGSLRLMRYDEVSALLIIILVMVTAIDSSGSALRSRLK